MLNSVILLVSALSGTMAKMPRGWPGVTYGKRDMGAGFEPTAIDLLNFLSKQINKIVFNSREKRMIQANL